VEQQGYYRAYLDDNGRAMNQLDSASTDTLNITEPGGQVRFVRTFQETKRQVAAPIINDVTQSWRRDDRRAILRALTTTDVDSLPNLELRANCPTNTTALQDWADRWLANRNAPTPRPVEAEVVHGEFIAPY
jgi:hypothetical protein